MSNHNEKEDIIKIIWEKGHSDRVNDPNIWRKDECGAWIKCSEFGNMNSQYGWVISECNSVFEDPNSVTKIPLQWQNDIVSKNKGKFTCAVIASGKNNIRITSLSTK